MAILFLVPNYCVFGIIFQNIFGNSNNSIDKIIALDLMFLVFSVPILSIYLARVYHDVIGRPNYVIDWNNSIISKGHNEDVKKAVRIPIFESFMLCSPLYITRK